MNPAINGSSQYTVNLAKAIRDNDHIGIKALTGNHTELTTLMYRTARSDNQQQ
jgi:hypothetical protein